MANSILARTAALAAKRVPGLRNVPVMRLLMLAEVAMLAKDHIERLTPRERRRLVVLVRDGRGRPKHNLTPREREELEALIAKADPKLLASEAAERLSPLPLPKRFRAKP